MLDLRGVTFIDSIGLRLVFRACGWCERRGVEVRVAAGSEAVRRLLRVTGADMWLPLIDDVPLRMGDTQNGHNSAKWAKVAPFARAREAPQLQSAQL